MSNNSIPRFGRSNVFLLLVAVTGLTVVTFAWEQILWPNDGAKEVATTRNTTVFQQNRSASIESELVTVTRRGFEPRTIVRPHGKFILMIENATLQDLDLRFSAAAGQSLNEVRFTRDERDWNEIMDLNPGRYVLTELNHPEWTCVIIIEAH